MSRAEHRREFYALMGELRDRVGGFRVLGECSAGSGWPTRGVYFFFEQGERRRDACGEFRAVRVGTHALKTGAKTTLWQRLSQHRGVLKSGGGNHRGSVSRLWVGAALAEKDRTLACSSWGCGSSAPKATRKAEHQLECLVSQHIRAMRLLWLRVEDEASPASQRGSIERNAIGLLSNWQTSQETVDPTGENWLGRWCPSERVRRSGLWNSDHVDEAYDPGFLDVLSTLVRST